MNAQLTLNQKLLHSVDTIYRMTNTSNRDFALTTELQTESDAEDGWGTNNSSSSEDFDGDNTRRREVFPCSPM